MTFFADIARPAISRRRLLFGIFSATSDEFLGSGVSGPIRVLANNDVPKGAACLRIRSPCGSSPESDSSWVHPIRAFVCPTV